MRARALVPALAALLVAATLVVMWPALSVPFFFDDVGDIVNNPDIRQLWPPRWLTAGPPSSNALAGRPVSALSFAISHALYGLDPARHHAANLLLHAACALLLFGLVRRTLVLPRAGGMPADRAAVLAAAVALLWAVHPLVTEPVAYAIQRTEQLGACFYLLTLYAAVRALDAPSRTLWTAVAVVACGLGMGSKEVVVSAPLAVVAFDWVFLEREERRRRRGLYAGLAATWIVLGALLLSGKQGAVALHADEPLGPMQYLWTQGKVITRYLRLVVWPAPLALAYDWPQKTPFAEGLPYVVLVAALAVLAAWALWRRLPAGFAAACVFLVLAPTSSLVPLPTEVAAERRMYLPAAAVIALLVVAAARGLARLEAPGLRRAVAGIALVGAACALGLAARHRLRDYRSPLAIWEDTARKSPHHSTVLNNYARELILAGRHAEAVPLLREAAARRGDVAVIHYLLGFALLSTGDAAGALQPLREAVRLDPRLAGAQFALGKALAARGDWPAAAESFERALALQPDDAESRGELARAHNNLASQLVREGRPEEALRHLEDAVRLQPSYALGHLNLGNALAAAGRWDGAVHEWLEAVRVAPGNERVRAVVTERLRGLPPAGRASLSGVLDERDPAVRAVLADVLPRP